MVISAVARALNKRTSIMLALLILMGGRAAPLLAEESIADDAVNIASVRAFVPERIPSYSVQRQFVGQVVAKQTADIGFELAGKISQIYVDEGDRVSEGDILMQLDTELLEIEFKDLQAQLQVIDADSALVRANLQRIRSLKKSGYASEQSLDELTAQQKSLRANRARVESSIQANRTRVEKSTLLAPYDGIIDRRSVAEGTVVGASQPVLQVLQQGGNEVKVGIPVRLVRYLDPRQKLSVSVGEQNFAVSLLTKGGQVDPTTRTVQLRFAIQDQNNQLVSGQLAYLNVVEDVPEPGYWVPLTAITDGIRGLWNLYAIIPAEDGYSVLERRDVLVRYATETEAFVQGALAEDEAIVATGMHRYVPGQTVEVSNPNALQN